MSIHSNLHSPYHILKQALAPSLRSHFSFDVNKHNMSRQDKTSGGNRVWGIGLENSVSPIGGCHESDDLI